MGREKNPEVPEHRPDKGLFFVLSQRLALTMQESERVRKNNTLTEKEIKSYQVRLLKKVFVLEFLHFGNLSSSRISDDVLPFHSTQTHSYDLAWIRILDLA